MSLLDVIKERIEKNGPISLGEYMALALGHPEYGYYMRKDPLGAKGDFITAPEISQVFGELLGAWIAEQWRILGKPHAALIELGPGRGTLMSDILRATKHVQGFHDAIGVHLVETSPALKQKQWSTLIKQHPRIEWHETISSLPDGPWLLVANEFFDALPIRQFVHKNEVLHERMVGMDKNQLQFVTGPAKNTPGRITQLPSTGSTIEYCEAAEHIIARIADHIQKRSGVGLMIDYGYEAGYGDTLQAVKNHQFHDPLLEPGTADITALVDFATLKTLAEAQGAKVYGPKPQGAFLGSLGAVPRAVRLCEGIADELQASIMAGVERLLSPDKMGERFKAMCIVPSTHPKPEGF